MTIVRFLKAAGYPTLMLVMAALLVAIGLSLYVEIAHPILAFTAISTVILTGIVAYLVPFIVMVGAPIYLLLKHRLGNRLSIALSVLATLTISNYSFPLAEQCSTSLLVRWRLLNELQGNDQPTIKTYHTLDDDFEEEKLGFPLSRICPRYFDYSQNGQVRSISIHDGEVFHGNGPVQ